MSDSSTAKALNILLVSPLPTETAFGGIGSWTLRFTDALKNYDNVKIKVVNSLPIDKKGRDIARSKNLIKKLLCNLRILRQINKEIAVFKPNLVHLNSSCTPFACLRDHLFLKAVQKEKIASVLHCRSNVEDQLHGSKLGLSFFEKNINKASAVLTLNQNSNQFVKKRKKKKNKTFVVPNFLDESFINDQKNISEVIERVIFVGHLVKQKGIDEIIYLAKRFPNIHFTLVAGYTEEYPNNSFFPKNVEITGNILLKFVSEKLDQSDLFLLPTYSEGFSNALLEAMARGLPIITTDVGANVDMLENKGGVIVCPKQKEALVKAMEEISGQGVREKMSKWNINKVKKAYVSDIVVDQIVDIYKDLI